MQERVRRIAEDMVSHREEKQIRGTESKIDPSVSR
jgi:hypothetical protein